MPAHDSGTTSPPNSATSLYGLATAASPATDARPVAGAARRPRGSIAWAKSALGWGETSFVPAVQWLVALFGGEVVPLSWAGITSGRHSRGHRFLANRPLEIAEPASYVGSLRAAHVVVEPELRRDMVLRELGRLEQETGLRVRPTRRCSTR